MDKLLKLVLFLKLFRIFENEFEFELDVVVSVVEGSVEGIIGVGSLVVIGITLRLHNGQVECDSSHVIIRNGTKQ
jgi:hypothetical protein